MIITKELNLFGDILTDVYNDQSNSGIISIKGKKLIEYRTYPDGRKITHFTCEHSDLINLLIFKVVDYGKLISIAEKE